MKTQYATSPAWLKALMNAWADGLNFYLAKHPEVKPRVITHFEPWMALTFSEGSIGGDIETINLNQLQAFYGNGRRLHRASRPQREFERPKEPARIERHRRSRPSNTIGHHALLLINPHTSFFFPIRIADDQRRRAERLRRGDLGAVLHLSGLQRALRLDAHVERRRCRWTNTWKRS